MKGVKPLGLLLKAAYLHLRSTENPSEINPKTIAPFTSYWFKRRLKMISNYDSMFYKISIDRECLVENLPHKLAFSLYRIQIKIYY